jgi:hypothetical protein
MSLIKGLAGMKKHGETRGGGGRFLVLKDGESVRLRFLQELDPESAQFDKERGLGFMVIQHAHPTNFKKTALCTMEDEGRCLGCERALSDADWKQKTSLFIAVLVTDKDGNKEPRILRQGWGPKTIVDPLLEAAEEYGSISDREWKLKRTGTKFQTQYTLTALDRDQFAFDFSTVEMPDVEKALRKVAYKDQASFYSDDESEGGESAGQDW